MHHHGPFIFRLTFKQLNIKQTHKHKPFHQPPPPPLAKSPSCVRHLKWVIFIFKEARKLQSNISAAGTTTPATPLVAPTGANPFPGLLVDNGVYIRRPGFADPPTLPERPANIGRTELWADGATFFPIKAGNDLGEIMRGYFDGPYINFSDIPLDRRFTWLERLGKLYWWPDHRDNDIRKCYKSVAGKRLRDMINDQKALAKLEPDHRKEWLKAEYWEEMKKKMDTPAYKAKCDKARAARAKGGLHTGGSIPTVEHFRRMCDEAVRAGEDPQIVDFPTIFQRTHKRKKDGKLVDERAAKAYQLSGKKQNFGFLLEHL